MQMEQDIPASVVARVYLLGPLELWKKDASGVWKRVPKEAWKNNKPARAVLKRLLVQPGRRLARSTIEDDIWSESDNVELATKNAYNAISLFRGIIGKPLVTCWEAAYAIADQSLVWTDLDACAALLKEAENRRGSIQAIPLLEQAVILLERGELLEGENGRWCYAFRQRAEDLFRQARLFLAESYEAQGKCWQAGEQYRALIFTNPSDEDALQRWLGMLARHGKRQEALKCYQGMKSFVETQGFPLSTETEQWIMQIHHPFFAENQAREAHPHLSRRSVFGLGVGLTVFSLSADALGERLLFALKQQHTLDTETIQYLHQRAERYWEQRYIAKLGAGLTPYIAEDLHRIFALFEKSLSPQMRADLCVVAGNLLMLLGGIFYDSMLYPTARHYYKKALIAAHEANNDALKAVVYGQRSFTWTYQGQLKPALANVQYARQLGRPNSRVASWCATVEAEIQAKSDNHHACLTALDDAWRLYSLPVRESPYWLRCDASLLWGYDGVCFLKLNKPVQARQSLTNAFDAVNPTADLRKPLLLIDLADSYLQEEEFEPACDLLSQAITFLEVVESPVTAKRLLALRKRAVWPKTSCVQTLDDRLDHFRESRGIAAYDSIS